MMCKALNVSRSSYYHWMVDPKGKRKRRYMELDEKIKKIYFLSKAETVVPDFKSCGTNVSHTTIVHHMNRLGLRSKLSKKFKVTTDSSHNYKVFPNYLNRDFSRKEPVKACVSDLTYILCLNGFLYLTGVLDFFAHKPIGWSVSENMKDSNTVDTAIRMVNRNRSFKEEMIFHSDKGIKHAEIHEYNP